MENSKRWLELLGLIDMPNVRLGFVIQMINDDWGFLESLLRLWMEFIFWEIKQRILWSLI